MFGFRFHCTHIKTFLRLSPARNGTGKSAHRICLYSHSPSHILCVANMLLYYYVPNFFSPNLPPSPFSPLPSSMPAYHMQNLCETCGGWTCWLGREQTKSVGRRWQAGGVCGVWWREHTVRDSALPFSYRLCIYWLVLCNMVLAWRPISASENKRHLSWAFCIQTGSFSVT